MYIHKKIFCISAFICLNFLLGCATSYAPSDFLPETDEVPQNPYGGWITIITEPDSLIPDDKWMMLSGEFISTDQSVVYLLYDSLYQIPKKKITNSILELDDKNTTGHGLGVLGGSVFSLLNGFYAVFTLPLWLGGGIPIVIGESGRDRYEMEYPDDEYWDSVKVFARFPQGVEGIDLSQIKPYNITKE